MKYLILFFSGLFINHSVLSRNNLRYESCSYLEEARSKIQQAKNWNCYIEISGHWAEAEKSSMCHGNKPSQYFLAGSERANEAITIRNTSYKNCQDEYERIQNIQKKATNFGAEDSFLSIKKKKRSRAPFTTYYYRKMTIEKVYCRFYEYRYQYYLF